MVVPTATMVARRLQRAAARGMKALQASAGVVGGASGVQSGGAARGVEAAFMGRSQRIEFRTASSSVVAMAAAVTAMAVATAAHCEGSEPVEGGYKENPIQHVAALLRLYDEIDRNMEVLAGRMLEDLQKRVEKEKEANGGKLSVTNEQIALSMSIEFETTLENVQDAVFRNNYVTKDHVRDALQRMMEGKLRGSGAKGKLTVEEAEAIEGYVKKLERLRWKVTGSREPLIPTHNKALVKQEKPEIPLETVVQVMEKLIPTLTTEMETIARRVRADHSELSARQQHQRIAGEYIKRSGELTEHFCQERALDLRAFQAALIFYHDDPVFETALARLSADQQRRFAALGL